MGVGALLGGIGCLAAISMVMSGASTDRRGAHCLHFGAAMAVSAVGFAAAALLPTPAGRIGGLALAWIGMISGNPPFWCLPSMLLRGSAAAAGIALVNTLGAVGGLVGPYAVGRILDATGSTSAAFLSASVLALISAGIVLRLRAVSAFTIAQRRVAGGTPALAH
jgi:ACS family tartrate transporter-like MFS transporter